MPATDRQHQALQTIFSFFLGLMVLAFVGVGVNTFYPSPSDRFDQQRRELSQRQEMLDHRAAPGSYSAAEQAQLDSLISRRGILDERQQMEMKAWARVTSIVLVLAATVVLVISLLRSEQLRVISNGLLLGGLFIMVYGVGFVVFSGNSVTRFWVILFALAVAIGLGYVKFVRGRRRGEPVAAAATGGSGGDGAASATGPAVASLAARVEALEERTAAAASALSGNRTDEKMRG